MRAGFTPESHGETAATAGVARGEIRETIYPVTGIT